MEAPKPPTTPTITRSLPRTDAAVSGPPRPFWIDRTGVSFFRRGVRDAAAAATCIAFVARTTRSQGPASRASVVAFRRTVRSPEAPSTRRPRERIASTWSFQRSMAQTSWPAEAKSAAYTEPMAPVPTMAIFNFFSNHFEKTRRAHAAADAHRHHHQLRLAALAFDERMADEARAAHPVGMAERDGPAIDVESLVRNAHTIAAIDDLDREGFVQLPQVDVPDLLAGLLEELRHREHRADSHLARVAAGDREAAENTERGQIALRGFLVTHDHGGRSAVGELAGVARGDAAAFDRGLDLRHALVGGIGADALVLGRGHFVDRILAGRLVDHLHLGGDGHDLVLELAGGACFRRALLALHAVPVLVFARDLVAARHVLGGLQHRPVDLAVMPVQPLVLEMVLVHLVLHQRDRFHAARDVDPALASEDALRRERDRLQTRGAETVHRHSRHRHWAACADRDLAGNVPAGRAFGIGAADDHVLDLVGVDLGALQRAVHHVAAHLGAMGVVERAPPAPAKRRARRGHNDSFGHLLLLFVEPLAGLG